MKTLSVEGAELVYDIEGSGPKTLAFAHGWLSHRDHWAPQADRFSADHQVVRWDRRGMGASTSDGPVTSARHAADLVAILDHEKIDRVVIAGHAGGGPTALSFATDFADRTDGLIMVDTRVWSSTGDDGDAAFAAGVETMAAQIGPDAPDSDTMLAGIYASFFGPGAPPEVVAAAVDHAVKVDRTLAIAEIGHMLTETAEMATQVRSPVLWVSAQPEDTAQAQAAFGDVQVGHVVGSGHFVQVEVPDQLNSMIATFLRGL